MRLRTTDSIALSGIGDDPGRASVVVRAASGSRYSRTVDADANQSRPDRAVADRTGRSLMNVPLADSRSVTTSERAFDGERAVSTGDRLIVDVDLALRDAADGHRRAFDERIDERGSADGNLNGRGHGYRIPVSCTPRWPKSRALPLPLC